MVRAVRRAINSIGILTDASLGCKGVVEAASPAESGRLIEFENRNASQALKSLKHQIEEITMQRILAFTVLLALRGVMAFAADDHPTVETFLCYTYMRANSATNGPAFSMNGGTGQVAFNFNKYIGLVADIGAGHNGNISDV